FPVAGIDEVVPVGNLIVDRAAWRTGRERAGALAIGHAAIHAARRLSYELLLRQRQNEFAPVPNAFGDRLVVAILARIFEKAGDLPKGPFFLWGVVGRFLGGFPPGNGRGLWARGARGDIHPA